jgi:hypothetical protein
MALQPQDLDRTTPEVACRSKRFGPRIPSRMWVANRPRRTEVRVPSDRAIAQMGVEFGSDADDVGQVDALGKPNGWATSALSL